LSPSACRHILRPRHGCDFGALAPSLDFDGAFIFGEWVMSKQFLSIVVVGLCALGGAGCSSNQDSVDAMDQPMAAETAPAFTFPPDRYALANQCFALKSQATGLFVVKNVDGSYAAAQADRLAGYKFFMKPTGLGTYLFYGKDKTMLAASGSPVGSVAAAADVADWTIDSDGHDHYTIASASAGKSLAVDPASGKLVLADAAAAGDAAVFTFRNLGACSHYPEITVNATGPAFKSRGVDKPVLGFADVHLHVSATTFLGGAHYGAPFHRFGVTEALGDCAVQHGDNGREDFVGNVYGGNPLATHETKGWPTFADWPKRNSLTHEATYYKWIQRAWKAGLRVLLNNVVENETLCTLERNARGLPTQDCNEMNEAREQIKTMHAMEQYIDAQEGGPGKGWFRIVTTPAEARQVIADGKLAVVLGIEISHLFDCNLKRVAGQDTNGCTNDSIDAELDELYSLGVREMFPIHEFDNALGGNGIFDGEVLNVGNKVDTGEFWTTYACPDGGQGDSYLYSAGAVMTGIPSSQLGNPLIGQLLLAAGGQAPIYGPGRQCNARFLTDLGKHAIQRMMDKGIIIEVDHLELHIKDEVIAMAEAHVPKYPLVSTHGGHGGITMAQAGKILELGGIIYPMHGNGQEYVGALSRVETLASKSPYFAMGYGADTNGMAGQAGPRSGNFTHVTYPFTLFQGPDWGPEFKGIAPVTFDKQVSGTHVYDTDVDGMAHYGMIADWIEEVRLEGHKDDAANDAIHQLYRSAEAYLQMWERTRGERK
jgi:hypothetical protein